LKSRPLLYLAVAIVAGCESPATYVNTAEKPRVTYALREEPLRAAACIARNIDRYRSPYSARIRSADAPAIAEVIVSGSEVVVTAQLFARGDGSTVVIRDGAQAVYERDALIAAMVEGC
jgi:hypothetical protein